MNSEPKPTTNLPNRKLLPKFYAWERHDDVVGITIKLTGSADQWHHLLDLNREVLRLNDHRMRAGDIIQIPDNFPMNELKYKSTLVRKVATGELAIFMVKDLTNELDTLLHGDKLIPPQFVRAAKTSST